MKQDVDLSHANSGCISCHAAQGVTCVINYDSASSGKDYVHRTPAQTFAACVLCSQDVQVDQRFSPGRCVVRAHIRHAGVA